MDPALLLLDEPFSNLDADTRMMPRDALRAGAWLGLRCAYCCAALTAILLVTGVMDLLAMALVSIAISAERLARSVNVARVVGAGVLTSGIFLVGRAILV